tara:strand:+ start:1711 stop:2229 length:519 start_codon:yes stop_codon:yes gene_type:complete
MWSGLNILILVEYIMILEFNKFNTILYFLTGITISIGFKRWLYGSLIVGMSVFILLQYLVLNTGYQELLKYQNITKIPSYIFLTLIIVCSLFILQKSSIEVPQKLFSIIFLVFSIGFSVAKNHFKDKQIFSLSISNYVSSLLFMILLLSISIIPDNQEILNREILKEKNKIK